MSGIYKGYNPIFESLKRQVFEAETKAAPDFLVRIVYDTFVHILMNCSDPSVKTPDGFKAYMEQLAKSATIGSLKSEVLKKIDALAISDKEKAAPLAQNKQYLEKTFDDLEKIIGEDGEAGKKVMSMFASYIPETLQGIQAVQTQMAQNESLVTKYIAEKKRRTGEEAYSEEGEATKWYTELSKSVLDTATSFAGETKAAASGKQFGGNAEIQDFATKAQDYLKQANSMAVVGGRGFLGMGKIDTEEGKIKGKDYRIKAQNLLNQIIRDREEFNKLRYRLANVTPPNTEVTIICPDNMKYDDQKKACVFVSVPKPPKKDNNGGGGGGGGDKPKPPIPPVPPTDKCAYPIAIGATACANVKSLQEKLISLGSCIADILNKSGGADGKYGRVTAKLTNIVYAYITKSSTFNPSGALTQQVYDAIMGVVLGAPKPPAVIGQKESLEAKFSNKIFEREYSKGLSVLPFNEFSSIMSEAYYLNEDDTPGAIMPPAPQTITIDPALASCICKSYESGQIDTNCFNNIIIPPPNPTGPTGPTGPNPTGPTGPTGATGAKWKGLKPLRTGLYAIGYDESALSAIGKAAIGAVAGVVVVASGGAALAAYAPALAVGASAAEILSIGTIAQIGASAALESAVAVGIGELAGAGAAEALAGRCTVGVTVANGFITRQGLVKMTRGLIDTLDGRVSDNDMQAIMATLCVVKGAYTCTVDQTQAVSAWSELKRLYNKKEKEVLIDEIKSIGTLTVSDVENFPDFNSPVAEGSGDMDSSDAKDEIMDAISRLEGNEGKLAENLKDINEEQIQALIDGSVVTSKSEGSSSKKDEEEEA
jgi:hypothetical protein